MTDEPPAPPMKAQDTVIFLLGELKGSVTSLHQSVDNNARAQADINKANEEEHAKFREDISGLATAVAVLNNTDQTQKESRGNRVQFWSLIIGVPAGIATVIALLAPLFTK